jgi:hypothetical protein
MKGQGVNVADWERMKRLKFALRDSALSKPRIVSPGDVDSPQRGESLSLGHLGGV